RRARDKAGIGTLIETRAVATGEPPTAIESRWAGRGYGAFKAEVGEAVIALLEPIRKRYETLRGDPAELGRLLARGAERAEAVSAPMLRRGAARGGVRAGGGGGAPGAPPAPPARPRPRAPP